MSKEKDPSIKLTYTMNFNYYLTEKDCNKIRKELLSQGWNPERGTIKNDKNEEMYVEISSYNISDINEIMKG